MNETRWGSIAGWSVDFIRAMRERPLWAKILFRICLGEYAYREFIGLMDELGRNGFSPYYDYCCDMQDYHRDKIPLVNWWKHRKPIPLKNKSYIPVTESGGI